MTPTPDSIKKAEASIANVAVRGSLIDAIALALDAAAEEARREEREACAKAADDEANEYSRRAVDREKEGKWEESHDDSIDSIACRRLAAAIRAHSSKVEGETP